MARLVNPAEHVEGRDAGNLRADIRTMVGRFASGISPKDKDFLVELSAAAIVPDPADPSARVVEMTDREWARFDQLREHFLATRERMARVWGARLAGTSLRHQPHSEDFAHDEHDFPCGEEADEASPLPFFPGRP